ncbi:hypothetical protein Q8F55_007201 [Vanrija albida]|uniref:Secretory carrier-associated membrane protein n=1 Tax=Vanrija albida TaxID=181172 RepID=A0ABR3Q004_9TREE
MSNYGGQPLDANPFADPSNPFQQSNASAFSLESVGRATPTGGAANIGAYVADHDRRAQELEQKQRELEARERQLQEREAEVEQLKPNWPPFIPFLVHRIELVPADQQKSAKLTYTYWLSLVLALVLNFVVSLLHLFVGGSVGGLISSAVFLVFITIFSFVLWYYPIYTGWRRLNKRGAAILFYMFFIFFAFHIIFCLYMAIGVGAGGSGGLYSTIVLMIDKHWVAGIFGIITSIFWIFQLVGGLVIFRLIWNFKNGSSEINFANAKAEFHGLGTLFKLFRATSG